MFAYMYWRCDGEGMLADDASSIGHRIANARARLGKNRNQMARELGTSWQHVDRWEKGTTTPGPASLERLAAYLAVSVDWLLGRDAADRRPELVAFLATEAPQDISVAEVAWLECAPFGGRELASTDYGPILTALRHAGVYRMSEPDRAAPPHSGVQQRVDREEVMRRIREGSG